MDKAGLLKIADQYFIASTGLTTANLVRKIQRAEGHADCFATGKKNCDEMTCRWRDDCLDDSGFGDTNGGVSA